MRRIKELRLTQISRRGFLYGSAGTAAAAAITGNALMAEQPRGHLLLVGTATGAGSKGIYAYNFDSSTGELTQTGLATEADNPTFLALSPDKRTVFVANEINHYEGKRSGAVSSYTLDRAKAQLTKVNQSATGGGGTCYVSTDHTGRCVFGADYGAGSAASFAASPDGHLSEAVSFFQYTGHGPNAERQEGPHAHRVTVSPDNRFLLVNDLGLDVIHIYRLDAATAKLTPNEPAVWKSAPGSGPRALRFHPNGKIAYCVTEMGSSVVVLRWDAKQGTFQAVQEVVIKLADYKGETRGADIVIDRGARFAYAIDRFDNIAVSLSISPGGDKLTLLNRISCGGKTPRDLSLDPSGRWLLVANPDSDNISVLKIDARSGKAEETGKSSPISKPECLVFA
jgi:6-phosphogluconolactonase